MKKPSITKIKKQKPKKSFEKQLEQEFQEVEQWILERKKFFKKLAWLVGIIALILIVSQLYFKFLS